MDKASFIQLIDKYMAGTASEAEGRLVEVYLEKMEANNHTQMAGNDEQELRETLWSGVRQKTNIGEAKLVSLAWYKQKAVRLTAVLAAACAIFFFIWLPRDTSTGDDGVQTITVAQGEPIRKAILADGSLVWIKANSSLSYPSTFKGNNREVKLQGEALFEVAKDAAHPFIVHSEHMNIQVLGTSFNITDAPGQDMAEVAVLTGKVWVDPMAKSSANKVILQPYQKLGLNKKTGTIEHGKFESGWQYTQGTEYNMNFVNAPLDSISRKIAAKFNVVVLIDGSTGNACRVTGDFTDQSLTHTVDFLCKSLQATYRVSQDTVRISGVNCK